MMPGCPRYYDEILREEDPAKYEEMKEVRRTFLREHSDEYTLQRLEDKHKVKKARQELFNKRTL